MPNIGKRRNKACRYLLLAPALLMLALVACTSQEGDKTQIAPLVTSQPVGATVIVVTPVVPSVVKVTDEIQPGPAPSATAAPTLTTQATLPLAATPSISATVGTAGTVAPGLSPARTFPNPSDYHWVQVVGGLDSPVGLFSAGDGSGRLFVLEQPGRIRVVKGGQLLPEPFLDIRDRVGSQGSEQGLLGLAFHPRFSENGLFYINYTDQNGDTVIARFSVAANNPDQADPGSEKQLLFVDQPYANHNGGMLAFGPDGYLYMGLGDGGSGGDPLGNGQNKGTLLGKILRIDVNSGDPYGIPADNPFANGGGKAEIWAYGLRNPWRFSFDRLNGDLYIGDVGQGSWEEVDYQPAGSPGGENYGWNIMEGQECFNGANCDPTGLVQPIFVYPTHAEGSCAITGGYIYRGSLPAFQGIYLLGDYCSGRVWGLLKDADGAWQSSPLFETGARITSFGQDEAGELYLVDHGGAIYQLEGQPE